jgi:hypothetical protein
MSNTATQLSRLIWSVTDLLRGDFKRSDLAALWSLALCDCCWAWSGDFRGGWHPRVSGEGVTYRG